MQEISVQIDYGEIIPELRKIIREELQLAFAKKPVIEVEPRVTIDELLNQLHISKSTFNRLRKRFDIPCEYVGRRLLFQTSKVLEAM